jgi:hypothetical protein
MVGWANQQTKAEVAACYQIPSQDFEYSTQVMQGDRKVTKPIPDKSSVSQKINFIEYIKQKKVLLSAGIVHLFSDACFRSSSSSMPPGKE